MVKDSLLKAIVDGLPSALVVVDSFDKVVLWNKQSESVFGWRSLEVVGKPVPIVPVDRRDEFRAFTEIVRSGKPLQVLSRRQRKDGAVIEVKATMIPVRNANGSVKYIMAMHEPVGEALLGVSANAQHPSEQRLPKAKTRGSGEMPMAFARFTPRQRQIISLVADGWNNPTIAKRLSVTEQVIKNYLSGIYRELRIHSRNELIVWFNQQVKRA